MKGILHGFALLLAIVASHATVSAQEYEERPRPPRRPAASGNMQTTTTNAASPSTAADSVRIASTGATVRGDGDTDSGKPNAPTAEAAATANARVTGTASTPVTDAPATPAPTAAAPAIPVDANARSPNFTVKLPPPPAPKPAVVNSTPTPKAAATASSSNDSTATTNNSTTVKPTATVTAPVVTPATVPARVVAAPAATASALPLTSIYRVGEGDTLDIRILNYEVQSASTLYTVLGGGLLEYPLIGEPLLVGGSTTDEIDLRVTAELKRREVFEEPQVVVSVREYVSHTATINGLVENPGVKVMRREALPLYVLLAEAAPRSEAGQVVITSPTTNTTRTIDLADAAAGNTLVNAGDVLRVSVRPPQFFYIGGEVGAPGQKSFHAGLTLTQAVLASGGATRNTNGRVRVSRQGADGRLVPTEYNLKEIEAGRIPDPPLQSGDRVEIGRK